MEKSSGHLVDFLLRHCRDDCSTCMIEGDRRQLGAYSECRKPSLGGTYNIFNSSYDSMRGR